LAGLNPVTAGVENTLKLSALTMVTPLTEIEILPVVASAGTKVVILVGVDAVTTAVVLLNFTR
jgi:hypothetical protein